MKVTFDEWRKNYNLGDSPDSVESFGRAAWDAALGVGDDIYEKGYNDGWEHSRKDASLDVGDLTLAGHLQKLLETDSISTQRIAELLDNPEISGREARLQKLVEKAARELFTPHI